MPEILFMGHSVAVRRIKACSSYVSDMMMYINR